MFVKYSYLDEQIASFWVVVVDDWLDTGQPGWICLVLNEWAQTFPLRICLYCQIHGVVCWWMVSDGCFSWSCAAKQQTNGRNYSGCDFCKFVLFNLPCLLTMLLYVYANICIWICAVAATGTVMPFAHRGMQNVLNNWRHHIFGTERGRTRRWANKNNDWNGIPQWQWKWWSAIQLHSGLCWLQSAEMREMLNVSHK